jgi:NAD(P)-dependent dehydrogenase (short-subunit alcohol dehydrogenase family)
MTAIVTGAGRGFGRAIATALTTTGHRVVGVTRTPVADLPYELITADAADPRVAADLIDRHQPDVLVLNAGVVPPMGPVDELSWEQFERNWQVDTRHVFEWAKAANRFLATYGADESSRRGLGLRFATVLPPLTPATELGRAGVAGYAARNGTEPDYRVTVTAETVAQRVLDLIAGTEPYAEDTVQETSRVGGPGV